MAMEDLFMKTKPGRLLKLILKLGLKVSKNKKLFMKSLMKIKVIQSAATGERDGDEGHLKHGLSWIIAAQQLPDRNVNIIIFTTWGP